MHDGLGIATTIYVAVALGVFGTLTVDEVIDSGGTALAVAAEPVCPQTRGFATASLGERGKGEGVAASGKPEECDAHVSGGEGQG